MDIKLKYRAWVGEKHADIASPLINSDIETFAIEFAEWLVKNCFIPDVSNAKRTVCNCENVETTDIRLGEDGKYYHVLCKKSITN